MTTPKAQAILKLFVAYRETSELVSENNSETDLEIFTEGYLAASNRVEELVERTETLIKELRGFLHCHDMSIRMDAGNSNINVINYRIEDVEKCIEALTPSQEKETPHE